MMRKKWITIAALLSLMACKQNKIAYVDINKLMNQYKGMEQAKTAYKEKTAQWTANVDTLAKELERGIKSYEKERTKMTDKEKQLQEELLRNKQQQLYQYQEATKKKMQEEDQQLTKNVVDEVNAYIKEYGEKHDYEIILGAAGNGSLLYAKEGLDITKDVLDGMNARYQQ